MNNFTEGFGKQRCSWHTDVHSDDYVIDSFIIHLLLYRRNSYQQGIVRILRILLTIQSVVNTFTDYRLKKVLELYSLL